MPRLSGEKEREGSRGKEAEGWKEGKERGREGGGKKRQKLIDWLLGDLQSIDKNVLLP